MFLIDPDIELMRVNRSYNGLSGKVVKFFSLEVLKSGQSAVMDTMLESDDGHC